MEKLYMCNSKIFNFYFVYLRIFFHKTFKNRSMGNLDYFNKKMDSNLNWEYSQKHFCASITRFSFLHPLKTVI